MSEPQNEDFMDLVGTDPEFQNRDLNETEIRAAVELWSTNPQLSAAEVIAIIKARRSEDAL